MPNHMEGAFSQPEKTHRETPKEFRSKMELWLKAFFGKIEVYGEENIKKLQPGKPVIIATSHFCDFDVQVVIAELGKYFDIKFGAESVVLEELGVKIGLPLIGGEGRGIPIDYKAPKSPDRFNPANFVPMQKALQEGYAVVLAAHNPTVNWKLSKVGGVGVPYLATLEDGTNILPVAVDFQSDTPIGLKGTMTRTVFKRANVKVIIGEPIVTEKISGETSGPETLGDVLKKKEQLQEISAKVMRKIADMLPPEKRGSWQEDESLPL